ncbi:MAG TPA: transposase [Gemmatimonadales bacterium]|nr:transposase [Gemmatimonadales bacterium]
MSHSFVKMRAHLIWATKHRQRLIDPDWRIALFEEFAAITHRREARPICAGGIREHVHLLVAWSPALALSDLARDLKTWSCRWIHQNVPHRGNFAWQTGCSFYTVHFQRLGRLTGYILNQEQHHREDSRVGGWIAPGWKDPGWDRAGACPLCGASSAGRGQSPRLPGSATGLAGGPGLQPGASDALIARKEAPGIARGLVVLQRSPTGPAQLSSCRRSLAIRRRTLPS